jgi:ABC-type sugar transport system permease subunit
MTLNWEKNWERIIAFLFILPSLIAIVIFVYGFIGWTGWVSVSQWKQGAAPNYNFSGFDSYARLFGLSERYATGIDARRLRVPGAGTDHRAAHRTRQADARRGARAV